MDLAPWHYFLTLERAYLETVDFIEPAVANYGAYSNRFASLLLSVGSETDVIARRLCKEINSQSTAKNIWQYSAEIQARFLGMHNYEVSIPRYGLSFKPWASWGNSQPTNPDWWRAYNDVKHDRIAKVSQANLKNVLSALVGLFVLHLYLDLDDNITPYPVLFQHLGPQPLEFSGKRDLIGV